MIHKIHGMIKSFMLRRVLGVLAGCCVLISGCQTTNTKTIPQDKDHTIPVVQEKDIMPVKDSSENIVYKFKPMDLDHAAGSRKESSTERFHIVIKGETLYSIARAYSVTLEDLSRVNNMDDPSRILIGQKLIIPGH